MLIGAQIIKPDALSVDVAILGLGVKNTTLAFTPGRKNPGGQAQNGVHIAVFQQLAANLLPAPPSNNTLSGNTTAALPSTFSMLTMCCKNSAACWMWFPKKILPLVSQRLFVFLTLFIGDGHAAFLAKRRIGQHVIHLCAWARDQGIRALTDGSPSSSPILCRNKFIKHMRRVFGTISLP